jgi:hypothetical protein
MNPARSVAPWRAALLFFFGLPMATALFGGAQASWAACPAGTVFESSIRIDDSIPTAKSQAIASKHSGKILMTLRRPFGNLPVDDVSSDVVLPTRSLRSFKNHVWQLTVPAASNLDAASLLVSYSVSGSVGGSGVFVSPSDPSSVIEITVIPKRIERIIVGGNIIFRGYVDVDVDYTGATASGSYTGAIVTTVECK